MRAVWPVRPRLPLAYRIPLFKNYKMTRPAREYVAHVVALPPPRPVPEHEYLMT